MSTALKKGQSIKNAAGETRKVVEIQPSQICIEGPRGDRHWMTEKQIADWKKTGGKSS